MPFLTGFMMSSGVLMPGRTVLVHDEDPFTPYKAGVTLSVGPDGYFRAVRESETLGVNPIFNYFSPKLDGVGASLWIKQTILSGVLDSNTHTPGAWQQMNIYRSCNITPPPTLGGYQFVSLRYEISYTNGGPTAETWVFDLEALNSQ